MLRRVLSVLLSVALFCALFSGTMAEEKKEIVGEQQAPEMLSWDEYQINGNTSLSTLTITYDGVAQDIPVVQGQTTYDVTVPAASLPTIDATLADYAAQKTIVQATGVPGSGTVTVVCGSITTVYTINFSLDALGQITAEVNDAKEHLDYDSLGFNGVDERTGDIVTQSKDSVVGDITLPNTGLHETSIQWVSSSPSVVSNDGKVIRPAYVDQDEDVVFMASITKDTVTATKQFTVHVKRLPMAPVMNFSNFSLQSPSVALSGLSDCVVDSTGAIYIADSGNSRIVKYDPNGIILGIYGALGTGIGQFNKPIGLEIDQENTIYVADTYNNRIVKFKDADNNGIISTDEWQSWGSVGTGQLQFKQPGDVFIKGSMVYVADTYNHRIAMFNTSDAEASWEIFGSQGTANGKFYFPMGIVVDATENIWVADCYNNRAQRFTSDGTWLMNYPTTSPYSISVDASGNIYTAERPNGIIRCVNNTKAFASKGTLDGQFTNPVGIKVDQDGNMWVVDVTAKKVKKAVIQSLTWPTVNTITYGQTFEAAISGGTSFAPGTFTIQDAGTISNASEVPYVKTVTFTPTDTVHYSTQTQAVEITVNKADPDVTWPTLAALDYVEGLKLSDISLSEGFSWAEPDALVSESGGVYMITYTPEDTENYNILTHDITVVVNEVTQHFAITSGAGMPGDTVSIVVAMNDVRNLKGIQGRVNYDPESLELDTGSITTPTEWAFPQAWGPKIHNEDGYVSFLGYRDGTYSSTTTDQPVIMTLHFTIKQGAYNGAHPVTIANYKAAGAHGVAIPMGVPQVGSIAISGGHAERIDPVVTWPTVSEITYGQTFGEAISGGTGSGVFTVEDADAIPVVRELPYTKIVTFTPTDTANYNTLTMAVEIVVNEGMQIMGVAGQSSIAPTAPNIVVNDTSNNINNLDLLTMEYSIWSDDTGDFGSYSSNSEMDLSGNKVVKVRYKADGDISPSKAVVIVFTTNYGDIDCNGEIDISDVVICAELAVGGAIEAAKYTAEQLIRANVSDKSDMTIDISDVIMIAERAVDPEVQWLIEQRTNPDHTWPTVSPITHGQTLGSAFSGGTGDGTFVVVDADVVLEVSQESYATTVVFVPNDMVNYNVLTNDVAIENFDHLINVTATIEDVYRLPIYRTSNSTSFRVSFDAEYFEIDISYEAPLDVQIVASAEGFIEFSYSGNQNLVNTIPLRALKTGNTHIGVQQLN